MLQVVRRYVEEGPEDEKRAERLVALLAIGIERLLSREGGAKAVDFSAHLSVTTDGQRADRTEGEQAW